ncbi:hypothetical protein M4951_04430 [Blastopirellula sp. J2-11]|uniref:hypothetical protein n=1 Tax=Blastopirellula sp. J2-11 TaxID=2943192 RepID=UPI0021C7D565|nr:hypothetical protein [Blastopirellula sp. J2-11]UUO07558.1 hypothetical protein M4951_04430 [Blastopirellula sp. J2-11]
MMSAFGSKVFLAVIVGRLEQPLPTGVLLRDGWWLLRGGNIGLWCWLGEKGALLDKPGSGARSDVQIA